MKLFKKGFTLVELLVTIGILAVVAAGVIALIDPRDKLLQANDAKVLNDIGQIATAAQSYAAQNQGNYPVDSTALRTELTSIPTAPSGYTETISYSVTAFYAAGQLRSNRYLASCGVGSVSCYFKFDAGRTCYVTAAVTACP